MTAAIVLAAERSRSLVLHNPVIAGPGTIGYAREQARVLPLHSFGAVVTNTTTLHARQGNPQPRLVETPAGLLLSTGVQNPGLRVVLRRYAAAWQKLHVPIILSIAGEDVAEYVRCAGLVEEADAVDGLELEPELLAAGQDMVMVVEAMRSMTALPVLVRLPIASSPQLVETIIDLNAVGCDAVVIGSPWPGMDMDRATGKPRLSGGLLGPAIRPLSLRLVHDVRQQLGTEQATIIGAGGISSGEDVRSFLAAGATAVQVDTAMYVDPAAVIAMLEASTT